MLTVVGIVLIIAIVVILFVLLKTLSITVYVSRIKDVYRDDHGDLAQKSNIKGSDEIGSLAALLDELIDRLSKMVSQIRVALNN